MLTAGDLTWMRETSVAALPDTVRITRPSASQVLDTQTGLLHPAPASVVYEGVGRVRGVAAQDIEVLSGETERTKQLFVGTFPYDIPETQVGDVVLVVVSSDPQISGRPFRVTGRSSGSWAIDRRLALEAIE